MFGAFHKRFPNSLLVLVGDGPERESIEVAAHQHGVSASVLLPGLQDNVTEWLKCMDVFCLSSDQEGTSVTLIEAGMCALPSVVTNVGGNPEIVDDGKTGLVVPSGNEGALTDALIRLGNEPALRRAMGVAARHRVEATYSLDRMVDRYLEVYTRSTVTTEKKGVV